MKFAYIRTTKDRAVLRSKNKSSEGIIGLNLLKKYLITNLHRDLIINSPELIILYAYFTKRRLLDAEHLLVNPKHAYTYVCFIGEQIKKR